MKINPIIITDSREKTRLTFTHYKTEVSTLTTGDYSIKGMESSFSIERKSIPDLISSLTHDRPRFTRELERLRGYSFKRLLIVGSLDQVKAGDYRSKATPESVLGSLNTFEVRYDIPVVFIESRSKAAEQVETWAGYYFTEQLKRAQSIIELTTEQSTQAREGVKAC